MPPVEEDKSESIVLKKISVEKHIHVKERLSPKETVLDVQMVEPLELKISLETADEILKLERDDQAALKYFVQAPEGGEPEMTQTGSRKTPTPTGEKREVTMDHIIYEKDEPLLPDGELKLIYMSSEYEESDSREEKGGGTKLAVHKKHAIERVSDKSRVLQERKIPVHEKGEETESTSIPKRILREPYEPGYQNRLRKGRKSKISLQPEESPIKDETLFVKSITETKITEIPLIRSEERGRFTLEKSEVHLQESMKDSDIQKKTQQMKYGTTVAEIPIDEILSKEANKMKTIQDDEKMDLTSAEPYSLELYSLELLNKTTEPALKKGVDLEYPTEEEIPREKSYRIFEQSIPKPQVVEMKAGAKYSAQEGEPTEVHYAEVSEILTEKALLSDRKISKKITSGNEDKTTFSTHLKDKFRQSNAPEKLPVEKEFDTVITGGGIEGEASIGEHEKGVTYEIADRTESVKKALIQPPKSQDKNQFHKVHTSPDDSEEAPALKGSKAKTEEEKDSLTVEEVKISRRQLQGTDPTSDEKTAAKNGIRKSTSLSKKKEKENVADKIPSSKGISASETITHSSSIDNIITPKNVGKKEYWKSEPTHMNEQASSLLSEGRNLDAPGESHEFLDVPAKSHAKRGEEDCCQILPQSALTICFKRKYHFLVMFVSLL